jgi:hypothetical protein
MTSFTRRTFPLILFALSISIRAFATSPDTGISIPSMDPAVRPGDNFYLYANGGFIARTKLPADRAAIGVFSVLSDLSLNKLQASSKTPPRPTPLMAPTKIPTSARSQTSIAPTWTRTPSNPTVSPP